jgi:hypothetical protein
MKYTYSLGFYRGEYKYKYGFSFVPWGKKGKKFSAKKIKIPLVKTKKIKAHSQRVAIGRAV